MKKQNPQIAICHGINQLHPRESSFTSGRDEIRVTIGRLDDTDGKPRNFSLSSISPGSPESRISTGGCFARIWSAQPASYHVPGSTECNYFVAHGMEISHGDLPEYEHAIRALKLIAKRQAGQYETRGNATDAADAMGRWLEACGVTQVYLRPESGRNRQWLTDGEWQCLTLGVFVVQVRKALAVVPGVPIEASL